ncbi:MAG TPA: S41 family peptidase [Verrucomicrobiota bacterium]|nr:S41 family peptidase [Verrucomicrobiota bacterium]
MKRRLIYGLVLVLLAINIAVGTHIYLSTANAAQKQVDSAYPNLELFSRVLERVRKDYVDGTNTTYKELIYGALKGMISTLDPHSEFLEPSQFKDLQDDTQGAFGGLGIVIQSRDDFVTVVAPIEDTPGFRAGIMSGDRILKIDGRNAEKMSVQEAVKYLRGEPGSTVTITVQRPSSGEVKDHTLTRAIIKVDTVKDINGKKEFPLGEDKIGYVRITQFGEKTSDELETALKKLKGQGMRALILDLRWNPGGLLEQAVNVCEKFLPRGQLVVSTEGRNSSQNSSRRAMGRGDMLDAMPMVVLVNYGSASAAEIVSGCLQDVKRAVVLGETTFGKGSVQSILPFDDGSALRLTTAKYYTPSHKVIHEKGITPDIVVPTTDEEDSAITLKRAPGGLDTLSPEEREKVEAIEDPQLSRALDLLKGILLYGQRAPTNESPKGKSGKMAAK